MIRRVKIDGRYYWIPGAWTVFTIDGVLYRRDASGEIRSCLIY